MGIAEKEKRVAVAAVRGLVLKPAWIFLEVT